MDLRDVVVQALARDYPGVEVISVDALIDGYEVDVALRGASEAPAVRAAAAQKAEWAIRTSRMVQGDFTVDVTWR